jgi:hypothetical protein
VSDQPEFIWARLDNATLYADGSSPCVARTKEFANGTKYVRADASSQAEIERLRTALLISTQLLEEISVDAQKHDDMATWALSSVMATSLRRTLA